MRALLPLSAAVLLSTSSLALAQSFTISSGQTVTTRQIMNGPSAIGIVEAGGTIRTTNLGVSAIRSNGDAAVIRNSGLLATMGRFGYAIEANGNNAVIENYGVIETSNSYAHNVRINLSSNNFIANYGTMRMNGAYAGAVEISSGNNNTVVNYGSVYSLNPEGFLFRMSGNNNRLLNLGYVYGVGEGITIDSTAGRFVNMGAVTLNGPSAWAFFAGQPDVEAANFGTINVTGTNTYGVLVNFNAPRFRLVNHGTITVTGTNAVAMEAAGGGETIINSGSILAQGANSRAFNFYAGNTTLTLLPGSAIQGVIQYYNGAEQTATLNIEGGASTALTFAGGIPSRINANGAVVAIDPTALRVATADVSAASTTGAQIDALLDSVFTALENRPRVGIGSSGASSAAAAPLGYAASPLAPEAFAFLDDTNALQQPVAWLNGFGGFSRRDLPTGLEMSSRMAGLVAGVEFPVSATDTFGLMFGGALGTTSAGSTSTNASSGFAGLYGTHRFDPVTLDAALFFGGTQLGSRRAIIDNTIAGGISTATADYHALFIAPEIGLSNDFEFGGQAITARGALQYAGIFTDGYTEQGSAGGLTIAAQAAHQVTAKLSLAVPFVLSSDSNATTTITPRLGVDGTGQFGDRVVTGTLAGTPIRFDATNGSGIGVSAGMQFEHQVTDRWSVVADASAGLGSGGQVDGQAGLSLRVGF